MGIIFIKNMKKITTLHYSIDEWEDLKLSLFWSPALVGWGLDFILKARCGMGTWLYSLYFNAWHDTTWVLIFYCLILQTKSKK